MPLPGNGARAGSVPLDGIDAEHIADLLASAAAVIGALADDPVPRPPARSSPRISAARPGCASPWRSRPPTWTRRSTPIPASCTPERHSGPPARILRNKKRKRHGVSRPPRVYRLLYLNHRQGQPPGDPESARRQDLNETRRRGNRDTQHPPGNRTVCPVQKATWINWAARHQIARTKDTG